MAERRQVSGVLQRGSGDTAGKGRDGEAERLKGGRRGKGTRAGGGRERDSDVSLHFDYRAIGVGKDLLLFTFGPLQCIYCIYLVLILLSICAFPGCG